MKKLIDEWNEKYFNGGLSPIVVNHLTHLNLPKHGIEARKFVERMFKFMQIARFQSTDFTDELAKQLHDILNVVESVWNGVVLPFTVEGRHRKIDDYISCNPWFKANAESKLLDVGCGFPPMTTVETAKHFENWCIIGADPVLPHYIVYDERGDYATFDQAEELQYFQGGPGRPLDIWHDPETTRTQFTGLLRRLLPGLPENGYKELSSVEKEGTKLIKNAIKQYERSNLSFLRGSIGDLDVRDTDIVRCFNVLFYFDRRFRNRSLEWFAKILREGGLLICGVNADNSTRCRYTVYRKAVPHLVEKEFAFSIDNVRTLGTVSWATFHDDEYEINMLANRVGVICSDSEFRRDFDNRLDELLIERELYTRGKDGYLVSLESGISPQERERRRAGLGAELDREGYVEGAVAVLQRNGYDAWRNCVGHVGSAPGKFDNR